MRWLSKIFLSVAAAILAGAPATAAGCRASFRALVHGNQSAGPYEISEKNFWTDRRSQKTYEVGSLSKLVLPDAASLRTELQPLGSVSEVIVIRDMTYVLADGKWTKMNYDFGKVVLRAIRRNGFITGQYRQVVCEGMSALEGRSVMKFQYTATVSGAEMPITIYFDAATKLPVMSEGFSSTKEQEGHLTVRFRFGPDIKIEPPLP